MLWAVSEGARNTQTKRVSSGSRGRQAGSVKEKRGSLKAKGARATRRFTRSARSPGMLGSGGASGATSQPCQAPGSWQAGSDSASRASLMPLISKVSKKPLGLLSRAG